MVASGVLQGLALVWLVTLVTATSVCDLDICQCDHNQLVCDCTTGTTRDLILRKELFDSLSFSGISIANCNSLDVTSRALAGLPLLQQVSVTKISQLTLGEHAFSRTTTRVSDDQVLHSGILVNITDTNIPEVPSYCFQGDIRNIIFTSVNISRIKAYGFSSIDKAEKIYFTNVNVSNVEEQSFKRFSVGFLSIINSQFRILPTRAIMDVGVHEEVRLEKTKFDRIETSSINVHSTRNFRLIGSVFGYVERNAFVVKTHGDVSIHDNTFLSLEEDALIGFTVDKKYFQEAGKQDFIFENNTLAKFDSGALTFNTSAFDPRLDWVMINQKCSCDTASSWANDLVYLSLSKLSKETVPKVNYVIFCLNPKYTRLRDFQSTCDVTKSSLLVKVLICLGIALVILLVAGGIILHYRKKGKRYINVPTSSAVLKPASAHKGHILVVPEGKTYRETELHVIVEHAEAIVPTEFVRERPDGEEESRC